MDCSEIRRRAHSLSNASRRAAVLWGFVNQLPEEVLQHNTPDRKCRLLGSYVHDANHFLIAMDRRELRSWLQNLTVYYGLNLRGIVQVFPTTGSGRMTGMADILCRAIHWDSYLPVGEMQVRFFSAPYQLLKPHVRDEKGMLVFGLSEFLNMLEMAEIFKALLRPEEQREFYELLNTATEEGGESHFYKGRFLGRLEQRTRDMLTAWDFWRWPKKRIRVFYELLDYVRIIWED